MSELLQAAENCSSLVFTANLMISTAINVSMLRKKNPIKAGGKINEFMRSFFKSLQNSKSKNEKRKQQKHPLEIENLK